MTRTPVHLVAAARPNFMKVAPLYHALAATDWADARAVMRYPTPWTRPWNRTRMRIASSDWRGWSLVGIVVSWDVQRERPLKGQIAKAEHCKSDLRSPPGASACPRVPPGRAGL